MKNVTYKAISFKVIPLLVVMILTACGGPIDLEENQTAKNSPQETEGIAEKAVEETPQETEPEIPQQEQPVENKVPVTLKNTELEAGTAVFSITAPPSSIASLQFDISYDPDLLQLKSQLGPSFGVELGLDVTSLTRLSIANPIPGRLRITLDSSLTPIVEGNSEVEIVIIRFYLFSRLPLSAPSTLKPLNIFAEDLNQLPIPVQFQPLTIGP